MGLHTKSAYFPPPSEKQARQGLYLQRLNIPLIGLLAFKLGALSPASLSLSSVPGEVPERNAKGRFHFNEEEMRPIPLETYVVAWSHHKLMNWISEGPQPLDYGAEETQEQLDWGESGFGTHVACWYFQLYIYRLATRKQSQGHMLTQRTLMRDRGPNFAPSLATV